VSRILVISPHPDDDAIGCGGAMLQHAEAGDEVRVVVLTSGEEGGHGRPAAETARVREGEARAAARILCVSRIEFWQLPDGRITSSPPVVRRLRALLEEWAPDRVYAPHGREQHRDHRAALRLVRRSIAESRVKPELLVYEVWTPLQRMDEIVEITPVLAAKLRAIRAHRTQCRVLDFPAAARGLARYRGEMFCWPEGRYAEVFERVRR
jgi:LmbE family N-acetylglucosaminyl deacetylase